ncbi:MAG: hypothetical protein LBN06_10285 [Prevotellaceae bacterium]|jgi:hypothetical protein|nr:hypothetical protein [Prevotellaceae bacterium]
MNNKEHKNAMSFLQSEDSTRFDKSFFNRKLKEIGFDGSQSLEDFLTVKKPNGVSVNSYKYFITSTSDSFYGLWIDGQRGDGISWLAEKIRTLLVKEYSDILTPHLYILCKDNDCEPNKLPGISHLLGKRKFCKQAIKSGLMKISVWSLWSKILLAMGSIAGLLPLIMSISIYYIQIITLVLFILGIIGIVVSQSKQHKEKRINAFIDKINNNEIKYGNRYEKLKGLLADRMSALESPRIIIVDDFSSLDELSQRVIQQYYETRTDARNNREMWIILNTNMAISVQSKGWKNNSIKYFELLPLTKTEKKQLIKEHDLPAENSTYEVIKDVCRGSIFYESKEETAQLMMHIEKNDADADRFLYLIAANAFPSDMEFAQNALIEKISFSKKQRERDKYIPIILQPTGMIWEKELKNYFDSIKNCLLYLEKDNRFRVRNNIVRYIESAYDKRHKDLYCYCNGYWAICWYFVYRNKMLKINWLPKLAHHLKNSICLDDEELCKNMFEAHLFVLEKCNRYFLKKEQIEIIESALSIKRLQENSEANRQLLMKHIVSAYLNFGYLPERHQLKDIGYEEIYDFLRSDDTDGIENLLRKYEFLSNEIICVLMERYWEKILFLHVSDTRFVMRNANQEVEKMKSIIGTFIAKNTLQNSNNIEQSTRNIALWMWVNSFSLSHESLNIEQIRQKTDKFARLIDMFVAFSKQHIDSHNDIEQTMLYTTMQESAYIIIASILTIKNTHKSLKFEKLDEYLQQIIDLYGLKGNMTFEEIMKLLELHSIVWRQSKYDMRYYILNIVRIQLYCCWYKYIPNGKRSHRVNYTLEDEQAYKFKESLENIKEHNRLNNPANFTLCNLYYGYSKSIASGYFQKACNFTANTNFTKSELEYMFMCLVAYWRNNSSLLTKMMTCFTQCQEQYEDDILFYIANDAGTSYCHLINTLRENQNREAIPFFTSVLEKLKAQNTPHIEEAEALWENFEFIQLTKDEQLQNKQAYENFWLGKEALFPYSSALWNLLLLESSPNEILKDKIYQFLIQEDLGYNYSGHLELAVSYLLRSQDNKDNHYNAILEIVKQQEKTTTYKNSLTLMKSVYEVLETCTGETKYTDALFEIQLKESYNLFDIQRKTSYADFLCHLCNIWLNYLIQYDDKVSRERYKEVSHSDFANRNKFLDTYKHAPKVFVRDSDGNLYPNAEYLLVNELIQFLYNQKEYDSIVKYESLINECNAKAEKYLDVVITLIIERNEKYTLQIQTLKDKFEEQMYYADVDDEDEN